MKWLGIGGESFHDAGITLLNEDGDVEFATLAERYSGKKHDHEVPLELLQKYMSIPETKWVCNDNWKLRGQFRTESDCYVPTPEAIEHNKTLPPEQQHPALRDNFHATLHHYSHAAAAFMTRPESFDKEDCVMVVIDGIGEYRSVAVLNSDFEVVYEQNFPKSIGYMYANFTENIPRMHLKSNEDEYVVMGYSCYGEPTHWEQFYEQFQCIPSYTLEDQDGWEDYTWEQKYQVKKMHLLKMIDYLLDNTKCSEDAAASLQRGTEEMIYDIMVEARKHGSKLCYSGGVAQNIMANSRMRDLFDDVWIDVNPGDGGASLGAAAYHYMVDTGNDRINWKHPYLGHNIEGDLDPEKVVDYLMKHQVCGVANGPAEFSYRAYGNRSLIADVRYDVKDTVNEIKQRQKYRPFAPAILEEHADEYFDGHMNRWMQYTSYAKHDYSSVTHVDGSARVQLVHKDSQSVFRQILECYYDRTGIPMLLNTSLNIRGKPMVNDVSHAENFEKRYGVKVFTS